MNQSSMTNISKFYEEIQGQSQNLGDCWDDSLPTWNGKVKKVRGDESDTRNVTSGPFWDDPDYSKLEELRLKGVPEFDLASSRYIFRQLFISHFFKM